MDSSDRLGVEPLAITQREQDQILTPNIQHLKICDITIQNYSRDIYNTKKIVEKNHKYREMKHRENSLSPNVVTKQKIKSAKS